MAEVFRILTLDDVIAELKKLGETRVRGLGPRVFSYRGYYERNDIAPWEGDESAYPASYLSDSYEQQIGQPMMGYKGGDYIISKMEPTYCAGYGETGPAVVGFTLGDDGVAEPVLCDVEWW